MKKGISYSAERGAVLFIALIMLLVITVLAVTSMRGVALESRITSNRAYTQKQHELAEAALREGEFRYFGPAHLRSKLEFEANNCKTSNKLQTNGMNKPCLLKNISNKAKLMEYFKEPLNFFAANSDYSNVYNALTGNAVADGKVLAWMPYRGLDATESRYYVPDADEFKAYWNSYLISSGADESEEFNSEYGAVGEGRGTFYYLVTGQTNDEIALQSTIANIYVGLNN